MSPTMAYTRHGHAHVLLVHGVAAPTDAEWQAYVNDLQRWMPDIVGALVVTDGGGPTSSQRRAVNALLPQHGRKSFRTAVLSDSRVARGIVNALNLWNPGIRMFRRDAMAEALAHIGAALEVPSVLAELERLRERLAG